MASDTYLPQVASTTSFASVNSDPGTNDLDGLVSHDYKVKLFLLLLPRLLLLLLLSIKIVLPDVRSHLEMTSPYAYRAAECRWDLHSTSDRQSL